MFKHNLIVEDLIKLEDTRWKIIYFNKINIYIAFLEDIYLIIRVLILVPAFYIDIKKEYTTCYSDYTIKKMDYIIKVAWYKYIFNWFNKLVYSLLMESIKLIYSIGLNDLFL